MRFQPVREASLHQRLLLLTDLQERLRCFNRSCHGG